MAKRPSLQFYPADWIKDPDLSKCSPATRGIWIDLLCAIHEADDGGRVSGTVEELARCARCTPEEMQAAISELSRKKVAEISEKSPENHSKNGSSSCRGNAEITVTCRRMKREAKSRVLNAERQARFKGGDKGNAPVTKKSRSHSSSSSSTSVITPPSPSQEKRTDNAEPETEASGSHQWIMHLWNELADRDLPRCREWTEKRERHATQRLRDHPERRTWTEAVQLVNASAFCLGGNDRGWKASIDWLLERPDSITRLLEGNYAGRPRAPSMAAATPQIGRAAPGAGIRYATAVHCGSCGWEGLDGQTDDGESCPSCGAKVEQVEIDDA